GANRYDDLPRPARLAHPRPRPRIRGVPGAEARGPARADPHRVPVRQRPRRGRDPRRRGPGRRCGRVKVMTRDEYLADVAAGMKEAVLQAQVIKVAKGLGFLAYFTHDSRRSPSGWPDLVLVHPIRGRLLFRELKQEKRY